MKEFEDFDVDDITQPTGKRRKNSKNKGKRGELLLVDILNTRFKTNQFSRTVGSGNRWSQVGYVSKDYVGDLVCPDGFQYLIEIKFGYGDIDMWNLFTGRTGQFDKFLKQAETDAKRFRKEPLLCWKKDRQPWLVATKIEIKINPSLIYGDWTIMSLDKLLSLEDSFFFDQ